MPIHISVDSVKDRFKTGFSMAKPVLDLLAERLDDARAGNEGNSGFRVKKEPRVSMPALIERHGRFETAVMCAAIENMACVFLLRNHGVRGAIERTLPLVSTRARDTFDGACDFLIDRAHTLVDAAARSLEDKVASSLVVHVGVQVVAAGVDSGMRRVLGEDYVADAREYVKALPGRAVEYSKVKVVKVYVPCKVKVERMKESSRLVSVLCEGVFQSSVFGVVGASIFLAFTHVFTISLDEEEEEEETSLVSAPALASVLAKAPAVMRVSDWRSSDIVFVYHVPEAKVVHSSSSGLFEVSLNEEEDDSITDSEGDGDEADSEDNIDEISLSATTDNDSDDSTVNISGDAITVEDKVEAEKEVEDVVVVEDKVEIVAEAGAGAEEAEEDIILDGKDGEEVEMVDAIIVEDGDEKAGDVVDAEVNINIDQFEVEIEDKVIAEAEAAIQVDEVAPEFEVQFEDGDEVEAEADVVDIITGDDKAQDDVDAEVNVTNNDEVEVEFETAEAVVEVAEVGVDEVDTESEIKVEDEAQGEVEAEVQAEAQVVATVENIFIIVTDNKVEDIATSHTNDQLDGQDTPIPIPTIVISISTIDIITTGKDNGNLSVIAGNVNDNAEEATGTKVKMSPVMDDTTYDKLFYAIINDVPASASVFNLLPEDSQPEGCSLSDATIDDILDGKIDSDMLAAQEREARARALASNVASSSVNTASIQDSKNENIIIYTPSIENEQIKNTDLITGATREVENPIATRFEDEFVEEDEDDVVEFVYIEDHSLLEDSEEEEDYGAVMPDLGLLDTIEESPFEEEEEEEEEVIQSSESFDVEDVINNEVESLNTEVIALEEKDEVLETEDTVTVDGPNDVVDVYPALEEGFAEEVDQNFLAKPEDTVPEDEIEDKVEVEELHVLEAESDNFAKSESIAAEDDDKNEVEAPEADEECDVEDENYYIAQTEDIIEEDEINRGVVVLAPIEEDVAEEEDNGFAAQTEDIAAQEEIKNEAETLAFIEESVAEERKDNGFAAQTEDIATQEDEVKNEAETLASIEQSIEEQENDSIAQDEFKHEIVILATVELNVDVEEEEVLMMVNDWAIDVEESSTRVQDASQIEVECVHAALVDDNFTLEELDQAKVNDAGSDAFDNLSEVNRGCTTFEIEDGEESQTYEDNASGHEACASTEIFEGLIEVEDYETLNIAYEESSPRPSFSSSMPCIASFSVKEALSLNTSVSFDYKPNSSMGSMNTAMSFMEQKRSHMAEGVEVEEAENKGVEVREEKGKGPEAGDGIAAPAAVLYPQGGDFAASEVKGITTASSSKSTLTPTASPFVPRAHLRLTPTGAENMPPKPAHWEPARAVPVTIEAPRAPRRRTTQSSGRRARHLAHMGQGSKAKARILGDRDINA